MINRAIKEKRVLHLKESFSKARGAFLVNCIGMNVGEVTELRKTLKAQKSEMKVVRNTLARLSLENHPKLKPLFHEHLSGTNAFVFVFGENVSDVAKVIDKTAEKSEAFQIKCGALGENLLTAQDVVRLAGLPSREVLRAQFLGLLQASQGKFLRVLQEVPAKTVRLLNTYKQKQENQNKT